MDTTLKKNSYELLSMSDTDSDAAQPIHEVNFKPPRRKRLRKRLSLNRSRRYGGVINRKSCHYYGKLMSLSFIIIILCCWLLILSWLIVIFNDELKRFDNTVKTITAGNQGIPESLQKYHLQTKELQRNQSDLYSRVTTLDKMITNLTSEASSLYSELEKVQNLLKTSFDSSGAAVTLGNLSDNAKILLRRIEEINGTVAQLKTTENHLQEVVQILQSNLTNFKAKLDNVPNNSNNVSLVTNVATTADVSDLRESISALSENVTYLNDSLSSKFKALKKKCSRDATALESVKQLLNQNISSRLNKVESEFSALDFHRVSNSLTTKK